MYVQWHTLRIHQNAQYACILECVKRNLYKFRLYIDSPTTVSDFTFDIE